MAQQVMAPAAKSDTLSLIPETQGGRWELIPDLNRLISTHIPWHAFCLHQINKYISK